MGKIIFNHRGNKYTVISWSVPCGLMEIEKQGGKIGRFVKIDDKMKVSDFLEKLDKINFM